MTEQRKLSCHCGAVELRIRPSQPLTDAKRCDCSFCRRRGSPMLSVRLDDLEVVRGADKLTLYTWGTGTAQHYFCSVCGIYTHHRRRSDPSQYGVNLGAIEGVNPREIGEFAWTDGVNHPSDRKPV
ncbi:GFA family protein [Pseudoruegeria sp. HB172150]|uniref:GFA family protein n=1 Tax=Pseudoruegeria sp. HB172150 TaxID=2721164 RepID=UPI00155502CE|nr:GFA family protein [Pseudoruegeria sp. HB172150]